MDKGFVYENGRMMVNNGCPKCEELVNKHVIGEYYELCLKCQLEQAEATVLQDMNRVEEIKQKIAKEKENALSR